MTPDTGTGPGPGPGPGPDIGAGVLPEDPGVKRRRVRLLVTLVLAGTVAAIVYHYIAGFYLGLGYPRSTFLFIPSDHFSDWTNSYRYAQAYLRGGPAPLIYFPFAFLSMVAATRLPTGVGSALIVALFLAILVVVLRGWVFDREKYVLTKIQYGIVLVALSYPVMFALDRTNLEIVLFVFVAGFFYFLYVRESPWLAALCLAAAIAFKLYPATLLLLLLAERRFKPFVLSVVFAVGLTVIGVVALAALGHHSLMEVWRMTMSEKGVFQQNMVVGGEGLQHGHTLWGLLRLPGLLGHAALQGWQMTLYDVAVAAIFLALAYHVVFRETERWKRVLLATVAALLLPFVSADYTLIQLYFPLVFFLNSPRVSRWDTAYVALFAVLLVPVDYYYFTSRHDGVSISVIVYPIALLLLAWLSISDRQRSAKKVGGESFGAA